MDWEWDIIEPILVDQVKRKPSFISGFHEIKKTLDIESLADLFNNVDEARLQIEFNAWLNGIFRHRLPKEIKSLYFGIFSMVDSNSDSDNEITTIYFSGSTSKPFDDPDWACWTETTYLPKNKYLVLKDFTVIDQNIKSKSDIEGNIDVLIFHGLLNLLIINSFDRIQNFFSSTHESLYIGSGYDGGDILILCNLTKNGIE